VKLLLDTATFLWVVTGSQRLSRTAHDAIADRENELYLSVASAWEICVKYRIGKLSLPSPPERLIPQQRRKRDIETLDVCEAATLRLSQLPDLHKDPFDRLLICQAIEHAMTLVTPDPLIGDYPIRTLW
jgi:PIN domain nuclease of toxin-antitoxin system